MSAAIGPSPAESAWRRLIPAYALSGACALVYQVVWYHALADRLGASGTTFVLVLGAFIGGLGLGALASRRVYGFLDATFGRGLANYGRTELLLTLSAVLLYRLTELPAAALAPGAAWRAVTTGGLTLLVPSLGSEAVRLLVCVAAVGVPCFFMGLSFPYLCSLQPANDRLPSRLYAVNTFGACAAILLTEFAGLETLGYAGCFSLAALGTAAIGVVFLRSAPLSGAAPESVPATPARPAGSADPARPTLLPGLVSGFLCGGLQALAFAGVRLTLQATRAAFALLTFFAILAIWIAASWVHRRRPGRSTLLAAAWAGLGWCLVVWFAEPYASEALVRLGIRLPLPPGAASLVVVGAAVAFQMLVPYLAWSTLLPDLCDRQQARGENLSRTYGWNTLAFLAGVLVFGWLLPWVNAFHAARVFGLVAFGALLLLTLRPWDRPLPATLAFGAVATVIAAAFLVPRGLEMRLLGGVGPEGRSVTAWKSTPQHLFWVRENASGSGRSLMFDRHSMSGTGKGAQAYMRAMAHVPLLLHAKPETALLVCFGVGTTADAIRQHDSIRRVDVVDLNRSVFLLDASFAATNGNVLADPRLALHVEDGRQFLKLPGASYDLVTMEPPPPLQPGISRLYSAEYYRDVKARLNPGALVSQWLPEHQMPSEAVDLVVSTFVDAFPHAFLFVGYGRDLILVGSNAPIDFGRLAPNLAAAPAVREDLERVGLSGGTRILATILMTEAGLARAFGGGPLIEDGFVSLEALQAGPVDELHPRSRLRAPKPRLAFDVAGVTAALRASAPAEAEAVAGWIADPSTHPLVPRFVPPFYFARPR